MAITNDDLYAFYQFAEGALASTNAQSLHDLVDIWEIEHPAPELRAENIAAVQAAIRDLQNGGTGRPADLVIEELRVKISGRRKQ